MLFVCGYVFESPRDPGAALCIIHCALPTYSTGDVIQQAISNTIIVWVSGPAARWRGALMDEEKELVQQRLEQTSMNLAERDANLAERDSELDERDAALIAERALRTAAVIRAKTMKLDAAFVLWVAAEQSLDVIAGSSTD